MSPRSIMGILEVNGIKLTRVNKDLESLWDKFEEEALKTTIGYFPQRRMSKVENICWTALCGTTERDDTHELSDEEG